MNLEWWHMGPTWGDDLIVTGIGQHQWVDPTNLIECAVHPTTHIAATYSPTSKSSHLLYITVFFFCYILYDFIVFESKLKYRYLSWQ